MKYCAVAALLFVASCGDNIDGLLLEDLEQAARRAQCEHLTRCGLFGDAATCETYFRVPLLAPDVLAAVEAGATTYDPVLGKRCQAELAAASCNTTLGPLRITPESCRRMFSGLRERDEACAFDAECRSGACVTTPCTDSACCPGTCADVRDDASVGDTCDRGFQCGAGAFCGEARTCEPVRGPGEPCRRDDECAAELGCVGASSLMSGACRQMPLHGESCPYLRCAELGAVCSVAQQCVPIGLPGDTCTRAADCSPYAECVDETCRLVPALGEPCSTRCSGDAWCDFASGICRAPKANREPCTSHDQCETLYCAEGAAFDSCEVRELCF